MWVEIYLALFYNDVLLFVLKRIMLLLPLLIMFRCLSSLPKLTKVNKPIKLYQCITVFTDSKVRQYIFVCLGVCVYVLSWSGVCDLVSNGFFTVLQGTW